MSLDIVYHPELVHRSAFVARNATLLGQVTIGPEASVWFGAILRGDIARIAIGAQSNVQDGCILHADLGHPCIIGSGVTIGHGAVLHGAIVEDNVLIGMRAVIMNGAVIGHDSIVGAGAVVTEGKIMPPRSIVFGFPAEVRRAITEEEIAWIREQAQHYVRYSRIYLGHGPA